MMVRKYISMRSKYCTTAFSSMTEMDPTDRAIRSSTDLAIDFNLSRVRERVAKETGPIASKLSARHGRRFRIFNYRESSSRTPSHLRER